MSFIYLWCVCFNFSAFGVKVPACDLASEALGAMVVSYNSWEKRARVLDYFMEGIMYTSLPVTMRPAAPDVNDPNMSKRTWDKTFAAFKMRVRDLSSDTMSNIGTCSPMGAPAS